MSLAMSDLLKGRARSCVDRWAMLTNEERRWFLAATRALRRARVPFMLAGAFGLYHYTGLWRGTKDLDVLVLPDDRERAIEAISGAGLHDLFAREPYDRDWIYRSTYGDVIVDVIWQMANKVDRIDPGWFERAAEAELLGQPVRLVSAADLCWMKLFVFQRGRCDWPDLLNVIRGTAGRLNWEQLLSNAGPHWRLLGALTEIYDWLCPSERQFIPRSFRRALDERRRLDADAAEPYHADLFDSRRWLTSPGAGHPDAPGPERLPS